MNRLVGLLVLVLGGLAAAARGESVELEVSWSFVPATGVYTNNQTKISFPTAIAGFKQVRATPADEDGGASFSYLGERGLITLYLSHRLIHHLTGSDDCTPRFRHAFLQAMRESRGKTDSEDFFSFSFRFDGKPVMGQGVTVHFVNAPELGGPVYSEFGAVLVGDFLYYYRASFSQKAGLGDLAAFLDAIGFKGRTTQPISDG